MPTLWLQDAAREVYAIFYRCVTLLLNSVITTWTTTWINMDSRVLHFVACRLHRSTLPRQATERHVLQTISSLRSNHPEAVEGYDHDCASVGVYMIDI